MKYRLLFAAFTLLAASASANPRFDLVDSPLLAKLPRAGDFTMGSKDAPVVLVEYASLSCPHCAHFAKDVLPVLKKKYIDTGKLLYILRPYPLNEPALKAAELVDCVGEKEGSKRYYEFVSVLFDTQAKWVDASWQTSLPTIARVGGVGADMYEKCTTDGDRETKILSIKQIATKELNVNRTPSLFINSHNYDDDFTSADKVSAFIDKQLAAAGDKAPAKEEKPKADKAEKKPDADKK